MKHISIVIAILWMSIAIAPAQEEHWMPDANLRAAVIKALELPDGTPLTKDHLKSLKSLSINDGEINDLTGLEHALALNYMSVCRNSIKDLQPLTDLVFLKNLFLCENSISDISPLANLKRLTQLDLSKNQILDITPLGKLNVLKELALSHNLVENITVLGNLKELRELQLQHNLISDVHPLVNLPKLENLYLQGNPVKDITPLLDLNFVIFIYDEPAQETDPPTSVDEEDIVDRDVDREEAAEWMPNANLRAAVREALELPDNVALTKEHLKSLQKLVINNREISDLTGLEHAVFLKHIHACGNKLEDLKPLANLVNLTYVNLCVNRISNISPLANLVNLKTLILSENRIRDITAVRNLTELTKLDVAINVVENIDALANLKNLVELQLQHNRVSDITPLLNLPALDRLYIQRNPVEDVTPLLTLNLIEFEYDEVCKVASFPPSIEERFATRTYPLVFSSGGAILIEGKSQDERFAQVDLQFDGYSQHFPLNWATAINESETSLWFIGDIEESKARHELRLALNPSMLFLGSTAFNMPIDAYPRGEDSEYWLRDADGNIAVAYASGNNEPQVNFMLPEVQELIIKQVEGFAACGLFDGITFDNVPGEDGGFIGSELFVTSTGEERIAVAKYIFREIRKRVRDDFLIMINAGGRNKPIHYTEYVNGSFMETGRDYAGGYHYQGLSRIEDVLSWNEKNLRPPQINCLQGVGIEGEPPDSPENQRNMRVITTLGLTHSDGYVTYETGRAYAHNWHDFWDADLGRPVGAKAQRCDDCDGLFIREFTNGWAVYNRSGRPQAIQLPMQATGVASDITDTQHTVPDLDGDILLKQDISAPTGGVVKVLDSSTVDPKEAESDWMPDLNLRAAIIETLKLPEETPLRKDQVRLLRELNIDRREVSDLTGLEYAEFLQRLSACVNQIEDLRPLANLVHLTNLSLCVNRISDISPLANLSNLMWLDLGENQIRDITPLSNLTKLRKIAIRHNLIEDIKAVENLENLLELRLQYNRITDISPILNLPALTGLSIQGNPVKNIEPLFDLDLVEFEHDESQLETEPSPDVNGDGEINILDLVAVANAFGEADPDLNGDGVVNIQDLVIVANAF